MTMPAELAQSYSHPSEAAAPELLDVIVPEHGRQIIEVLVETHERRFEAQSDGLTAALLLWTGQAADFDAAWDVNFGTAHALLLNRLTMPPEVVGAALALGLNWSGLDCAWDATFASPARLRFGPWLLPMSDQVRVAVRDGRAEITTVFEKAATTNCFENGKWLSAETGVAALPVIRGSARPFTVLSREAAAGTDFGGLLDKVDAEGALSFVENCREAIALLDDFAPLYGKWVERVIRYLVPMKVVDNDEFESGSRYSLPSLVYLTNMRDPLRIAETLVHEASHQYFNILQRVEPLHDPSDDKLYFSAIKGEGRPLIYILLAYHACANIRLFFQLARRNGFRQTPDQEAYELRLAGQVRDLEAQLRDANTLTPCGAALWETLSQSLRE